MYGKLDIRP